MWLYYSNTRSSFLDIFVLIHDSETTPLKNLIKLIFSQLLRARTHTILKCPIFTYWVWLADAYIAIFNCGAKVWASLRKWSSPCPVMNDLCSSIQAHDVQTSILVAPRRHEPAGFFVRTQVRAEFNNVAGPRKWSQWN